VGASPKPSQRGDVDGDGAEGGTTGMAESTTSTRPDGRLGRDSLRPAT
jgi:hypothetical protein